MLSYKFMENVANEDDENYNEDLKFNSKYNEEDEY